MGTMGTAMSMRPASFEPLFYWHPPDGNNDHQVLARSTPYGGYEGDSLGNASEAHIAKAISKLGATWPFDSLLLQDGAPFLARDHR